MNCMAHHTTATKGIPSQEPHKIWDDDKEEEEEEEKAEYIVFVRY
jgi:hypothetical protein